jgi:hypothetical protein
VLEYTGSYVVLFAGASCAYLITLGIMHVILPRDRGDLIEKGAQA